MSRCEDCAYWKLGIRRIFKEATFDAPATKEMGIGRCDGPGFMAGQFPPAAFGCLDFVKGDDHWEIEDHAHEQPWEWWEAIPCPDCQGAGSNPGGACYRCAGTAKVRKYGDGFEGEEQHRLHPVEVEFKRKAREKAIMDKALADIASIGQPEPEILKNEKLPFS